MEIPALPVDPDAADLADLDAVPADLEEADLAAAPAEVVAQAVALVVRVNPAILLKAVQTAGPVLN